MVGTTAALIMGGLGAAGALGGAKMQSSAATRAATTQQQAAEQYAREAAAAGQQVVDATGAVNPFILESAERAASGVGGAAGDAADAVRAATLDANQLLNPFSMAGTDAIRNLMAQLAPGGDFNRTPTMAELEIDPGFAFRLEQGQKALERSAAARGSLLSGGTLKELGRFSQGVASDEYTKAYDRYRASTGDRFSRLFGTAGMGLGAAEREGGNLIGGEQWGGGLRTAAAEYGGNAFMSAADRTARNTIEAARARGDFQMAGAGARARGADAQAAGQVAGANAWAGGLSGATGSMLNAMVLSRLLRPAAAAPATGGGGSGGGFWGSNVGTY